MSVNGNGSGGRLSAPPVADEYEFVDGESPQQFNRGLPYFDREQLGGSYNRAPYSGGITMSDNNHDDARGISMLIAGFGLGTLVGTVIGLLIAPKSGRELRGDIADYSRDTVDKVKDYSRETYEKGREAARSAYESGREKASEFSAKVTDKASEVAGRAKDKVSGAAGGVTETASRLRRAVKTGIQEAKEGFREGLQQADGEGYQDANG
jgi:gas vesicle protein